MMLRKYWEMGYVVVVRSYYSDDEYSMALGDDFEDLPVEDFSECVAIEVDESERRVSFYLDEDDC